jgi:hypothetical protein
MSGTNLKQSAYKNWRTVSVPGVTATKKIKIWVSHITKQGTAVA